LSTRVEGRLGIAWASGAFPQAIAFNVFTVLFFRYLTDAVGLEAAVVGTIIGVSKFYDALIAPGIGMLADRIDTRMGRRRPWMLLGGIAMAGALVVCFNVPLDAGYGARLGWAALGYFVFATGYMVFAIPWLAMPPEITGQVHARTRMMAWRVAFSSVGQGLSTSAGPMLLAAAGAGALGYSILGWSLGLLCAAGTAFTVFATRNAKSLPVVNASHPGLREQWRAMTENRPFMMLLLLKATLYFGLAFNGAGLALLTRWVIGVSDYWLGVFTMALVAASLLSQPFWVWFAGRHGKRTALRCAFLGLAMFHVTLALNQGWPVVLALQGAVLGVLGGGVYMLTQSLLPDVIEHDFVTTGERRGGLFAGAVAFLETASSALAIFLMGVMLSLAGYVEGLAITGHQPYSAQLAIIASGAVVPSCFELLGLLVLSRFPLGGQIDRHDPEPSSPAGL
jgi:GPH family glycoside/pentoside/hexuronide:cation symporter